MRSYANRNRTLIVLIVMVVVVGSLWRTKTIAFTRSLAIAFSSQPHEYIPRGDPADITPTIVASFPFTEETVSLVADRIVHTYGGNTSDYESTLTTTDTTDFAGKVVTARGRTPRSTQRMANYGAQALRELINEATFARTGQTNVSFMVLTLSIHTKRISKHTELQQYSKNSEIGLPNTLTPRIRRAGCHRPPRSPHGEGDLSPKARPPLFGTDELGRDVLVRVFAALRVNLEIALAAMAISLLIGVAYGVIAYAGQIPPHAEAAGRSRQEIGAAFALKTGTRCP